MAKDRRGKRGKHAKKQRIPLIVYVGVLIALTAVIVALIAVIKFLAPDDDKRKQYDDDDTSATTTVDDTDETTVATLSTTGDGIVTTTPSTSTTDTTTTVVTTTTTQVTLSNDYPADGTWNLKLVNKWHPMTQEESELLPIVTYSGSEQCDSRVKKALEDMMRAGSPYGLWVTSSYRSYSTQNRLYENKVGRVKAANPSLSDEEAREIAASEVARPGTSEHNTGLAFDLLYSGQYSLDSSWENGAAFDWLMAHCHEYGFILRFPEGKEHITGVIYEPWHYRYVGVEAATEIMSRGITLEEYLQERGLA